MMVNNIVWRTPARCSRHEQARRFRAEAQQVSGNEQFLLLCCTLVGEESKALSTAQEIGHFLCCAHVFSFPLVCPLGQLQAAQENENTVFVSVFFCFVCASPLTEHIPIWIQKKKQLACCKFWCFLETNNERGAIGKKYVVIISRLLIISLKVELDSMFST